jgi:hypothetical protein
VKLRRKPSPLVLIAAGLIGMGLLLLAEHFHLPIARAGDFASGLWFGVCLGVELLGVIVLVRSKAGPVG